MSENSESSNERPCLHCLIGDLIDEYYAEYGTATGETDVIDIDETISALAKTIADLTYGSDVPARQREEPAPRARPETPRACSRRYRIFFPVPRRVKPLLFGAVPCPLAPLSPREAGASRL